MLSSCERFSLKSWKWEVIEDLNTPRMNASACVLADIYVYVFGGLTNSNEFLNSIEWFNSDLKIWTPLNIIMPSKISNTFAVPINEEEIIIFGGLKRI